MAYTKSEYRMLAQAVNNGFSEKLAEKILSEQRELGANTEDEIYYWNYLDKPKAAPKAQPRVATMQVERTTRNILESLKFDPRETFDSVVVRLLSEHEEIIQLREEVKQLKEQLGGEK